MERFRIHGYFLISHLSANLIIKYKNETIPRYLRLLFFLQFDSVLSE